VTIEAGDAQQSCVDCIADIIMYGPYKASSTSTRETGASKKTKNWLDHWNIVGNTKEIFFRDRDTNLNCMGIHFVPCIYIKT